MDNDDLRRGKSSNYKVFGEAIATLAGDALLSYGPQVIIENSKNIPAERVLKVLNEYMKAAGVYGIIAGQVADIENEKAKVKDAKTLEYIHTHKTADLFRLALKAGAIIAGADEKALDEMNDFANKFGLAFQIYDDILDEISTFEELGKTVGKDKASDKLTYVSLYGLEEAEKKLNSLFVEVYDIIDKYNSEVFRSIVDNMKSKITK